MRSRVAKESIDLIERVYEVFKALGYTKLTEVQRLAIPHIVGSDLDILISSPTGTGKTEAALIPLLVKLIYTTSMDGIDVVYVTPLRALNRDLCYRIDRVAEKLGLEVDVWHGDTPYPRRKAMKKKPPNILVTTPESLQIILVNPGIRKHLVNVKAVVVDEVQDLVTSERGSELVVALERLDELAKRRVRRIGISGPIEYLDEIARYVFGNRRHIIVNARSAKSYDVKVVTAYELGESTSLSMYMKAIPYIARVIKDMAENDAQVLVFVNTRVMAEEMSYLLKRYLSDGLGLDVAVHHGSLSRELRESVELTFREGKLKTVVATSSLELGIDIGGVDLVIQYLSPRQSVKLLQRVGRAGHREEKVSRGLIIVPPLITEIFESLTIARRMVSRDLEKPVLHIEPLDVLAHQIIGIALERAGASLDYLYRVITRSRPFSTLTLSKLEQVVDFLKSIGFLKEENGRYVPTVKGRLYYLTTNMIVDTKHYNVRSIADNAIVGVLDEEFVVLCRPEDVIVLGGKLWKIVSIDEEKSEVLVEPIHMLSEARLPKWFGENIPVYRNVMRETCSLIRRICDSKNREEIEKILDLYRADEKTKRFVLENIDRICKIAPRDDRLVVEIYRGEGATYVAIYHCLGTKGAEAFSHVFLRMLREELGISPPFKSHQMATVYAIEACSDPYAIARAIARALNRLIELDRDKVREILEYELRSSPLFQWRLIMVAKKFGLIKKDVGLSELKKVAEGLANIPILVEEAMRELMVEKLDIEALLEFVKALKERKIKKVEMLVTSKPSQYLLEILSLSPFFTRSREEIIPQSTILELVKRRLIKRRVELFCLSCMYSWSIDLENEVSRTDNVFRYAIQCPKCSSRAITVVEDRSEIDTLRKALDKIKKGISDPAKFSDRERELLKKAKKIANLVIDYGLAAIIALQGRGIGPETVKRVLSRSYDLDSLVRNVYEQEKQFLRTYRFWS